MDKLVKDRALRLYHRACHTNSGKVATVGISTASTGKPVFIVYKKEEDTPISVPDNFEGHCVLVSTAQKTR